MEIHMRTERERGDASESVEKSVVQRGKWRLS